MNHVVTLIIHGTFASEENWWRSGTNGETTFSDRIEVELARRGQPGTVWKPAIDHGFHCDSFAWSGKNSHRDRMLAARKLRDNLNELANRLGSTPIEPLHVNLIAHSHGGNVVLEALLRIAPNVKVNRIALLGTPLITVTPVFRLGRFALLSILMTFIVTGVLIGFYALIYLAINWEFPLFEGLGNRNVQSFLLLLLPMLVFYGWIVTVLGDWMDAIWRVVLRAFDPLLWFLGKSTHLAYGPSVRKLRSITAGRGILMLTSYNDEADLLLQIGSTPGTLYREYLASDFSKVAQSLELIALRPFMLGGIVKGLEVVLQVLTLGFSPWKAVFFDYVVAPLQMHPYYSAGLLRHQILDIRPDERRVVDTAVGISPEHLLSSPNLSRGLYVAVREVIGELKRQVRLRHSAYYENVSVLNEIAEFLTDDHSALHPPQYSSLTGRLISFWNAVHIANIGIAVGFAVIAGPAIEGRWYIGAVMAVMGYFPLAVIPLVKSFRRASKAYWYFWALWMVWALVIVSLAIRLRIDP